MSTQFFINALEQLDLRRPGALFIYLGILAALIYQYYREGTLVFREYGRMHREITKEASLQKHYTEEWKQRLGNATHLFGLGNWLVLAAFLLLSQFVFLMVLLQAPMFAPNDLKDARLLASKLENPVDKVSAYMSGRLHDSTRTNLATWRDLPAPAGKLENALVADINAVLAGALIWEEGRFTNVVLRAETQNLLESNPTGSDLLRLNRLLVEDAYPTEFWRKQEPRAEAQRLLGMGFIALCVAVALWVDRTKYAAMQTMFEFSRQ